MRDSVLSLPYRTTPRLAKSGVAVEELTHQKMAEKTLH
jgi:hypothetical protein